MKNRRIALAVLMGFSALTLASCGSNKNTSETITLQDIDKKLDMIADDSNSSFTYSMPKLSSTYQAIVEDKLPEIRITHGADTKYPDKNSTYFVTEPVSHVVKEAKKGWLDASDPALKVIDPYYQDCTITVNDGSGTETINSAEAQVKVRGNWTTDYDKKPLRIKFNEKQKMLGLNSDSKAKSWVLLAGFKDRSLLRDCTGLYLSKLISTNYTSDFRLVDVYINDTYWGVYILAEQQQVNKHRINIGSVATDYTGTDIGYLLEFDGYSSYEDYHFNINYGTIKDIYGTKAEHLNEGYTIKSDIYSNNQVSFISSYMNNVWKICYEAIYNKNFLEFNSDYTSLVASSATSTKECVSKVIDLESLVDTYVLQEIVVDPDLYFSSFYMDVDFSEGGDKKVRFEAPWDFDSTMGNKYNKTTTHWDYSANKGKGQLVEDIPFNQYAGVVTCDVNGNKGYANPWMILFARCEWFNSLATEKWKMISSSDTLSKLTTYIDTCSSKYSSSFTNNLKKWPSTNTNTDVIHELSLESNNCKTEAEAAAYLRKWLTNRFNTLDAIYK